MVLACAPPGRVIPGSQKKIVPSRPVREQTPGLDARSLADDPRCAMEDHALLLAWRSGQRDAGRTLIARHYAAVFRFFYGKVGVATCEDLAQQTFEALCRRPDAFRGQGSFRAYLLGIARFSCCSRMPAARAAWSPSTTACCPATTPPRARRSPRNNTCGWSPRPCAASTSTTRS